jgi:outer membrane protein TolC
LFRKCRKAGYAEAVVSVRGGVLRQGQTAAIRSSNSFGNLMNRMTISCGLVVIAVAAFALTGFGPTMVASQERFPSTLGQQRSETNAHDRTQWPSRQNNRNAAWANAAQDWGGSSDSVSQAQHQSQKIRQPQRPQPQPQRNAQQLQASQRHAPQQLHQQSPQRQLSSEQIRIQQQWAQQQQQAQRYQRAHQRQVGGQFQPANSNRTQQTWPRPASSNRPQQSGSNLGAGHHKTSHSQTGQWQSGLSNHYVQAHLQKNGASGVVTAHASVIQRGRVSANQWKGPTTKPVQPIQQVEYVYPQVQMQFVESTPNDLLSPFDERADNYPEQINLPLVDGQLKALPVEYTPWWNAAVDKPMRGDLNTLPVNVDSLITKAVEYSPQVIAMRIDPILRETEIIEEEAEFDWSAFLETEYDNTSDPIGNSLTAQRVNRYEDSNVTGRVGLRKRFDQGANFDISQRIGYQDNNSNFFVPNPQGTARLELNFSQPLLKGAGRAYNQGRIVLASINRNMTEDEVSANLQDHLVSVYQAYWSLYRARVIKLQKQRLLKWASDIQGRLEGRQGVDVIERQILRARAAVASRRSEIVRAEMAIRNAESRLRLLVNSPELKQSGQVELLPSELPMAQRIDISLKASIETSLRNRPEISRAIRQMKATSVRLGISKNELLPKLDLVLGTYVAGLRGNGLTGRAVGQQFDRGRPSYSIGFFFEVPLGNRAARARAERREWEVAKAFRQFESAVEAGMTDVELSARQMETAYQEMLSRFQAMIAAETEANYLMERWRLLPGSDQTISFLLEDLLDAQERVADQESDFVNAQVEYVLAVVSLKRAMGILVDCDSSPSLSSDSYSVGSNGYPSGAEMAPQEIEPVPENVDTRDPMALPTVDGNQPPDPMVPGLPRRRR